MKTKHICQLILLTLAIHFAACNRIDDFLDAAPSKTTAVVPTHVDHLEMLFNRYQNFVNINAREIFLGTDDYYLSTALFDASPGNYTTITAGIATWNIDFVERDGANNFWAGGSGEWGKIFIANMVLHYLPLVEGPEEQKQQLYYEARFIRAHSMWLLAQVYCLPYVPGNENEMGLPLKSSVSFEEDVARATLSETYAFIYADLQAALNLEVTLREINNKNRTWRASNAAVHAFMARFYQVQNNHERALHHADVALSLHNDMMNYNVDMRFADVLPTWGGEVAYIPFTAVNQVNPTDKMQWRELYFYRLLNHGGWWYIPSPELLDLYDKEYDLRYKYHMVENYSLRLAANVAAGKRYYGYLFFFYDRLPAGPTVAEMHLIRAEALVRAGDIPGGMAALNTLRVNRMYSGAPHDRIHLSASHRTEALNHVFEERRREKPFFLRWFDIRRLNSNDDPTDDIGDITRTFYPITSAGILGSSAPITFTLPANSRLFARPIPLADIEASGGALRQNTW